MFTEVNALAQKVHSPADRRMPIGIKSSVYHIIGEVLIATVGLASYWCLPVDPSTRLLVINPADPSGFPSWLCLSHRENFVFLVIIGSGLSILADHPRLY